jgi:hypothetical protein
VAETDRELRARLEAHQHEVRVLEHELTLNEGLEFAAKRSLLETALVPVRERVAELLSQANAGAESLKKTRHTVTELEQSLRESEQRSLSVIIALLAIGGVVVLSFLAGDVSAMPLAAVSGLGLGWLVSSRKRAPDTGVREEEPVTVPRELLGTLVPLLMLVTLPLLSSMHAGAYFFNTFPDVLRMSAPSVFVLLGGVACFFGPRGKLLAGAMVVAYGAAGLEGWAAFSEQGSSEVVDARLANIVACVSLPLILAGQWASSVTRGNQVWNVASIALLLGSAWSTWWLMTAFIDERVAQAGSFTSFARLALELSLAAGSFAFASKPGTGRRVLFALSAFLSAWIVVVFAVLDSVRFN